MTTGSVAVVARASSSEEDEATGVGAGESAALAASSCRRHVGLASPEWRTLAKPRGSTCCRNRAREVGAGSVRVSCGFRARPARERRPCPEARRRVRPEVADMDGNCQA